MMRYGWDVGGWGPVVAIVMMVVWIAIVVGIIALIVLGVRWLMRNGGGDRYRPDRPTDDPMEILRQRYARGEIDDEEYERRRRMLGGS
jgi:putative membrane protein